jgi:A/G-specific adenine glycosylase
MRWYSEHQRDLPWRHTQDPYLIWLSEVILQQTRVAQGTPYYRRFAAAFPTVQALAAARQEQVLRLWQGLGYYSRARNLHRCAQEVVSKHNGQFPPTYQELLKLPGIGTYTAAAIASFAYNETVPVVDGNVYRVLSRVFGIKDDIQSSSGQKKFREQAEQLVPRGEANVYNQAIMEFGALQCTPVQPACLLCPLSGQCYAYQHGQQQFLPVKAKKTKVRLRFLHYLVIRQQDTVWMRRRDERGIWAGLYDFYSVETAQQATFEQLTDPVIDLLLGQDDVVVRSSPPYQHLLTHQRLLVTFDTITLSKYPKNLTNETNRLQAYSVDELEQLPKPVLIDNFLQKEIF